MKKKALWIPSVRDIATSNLNHLKVNINNKYGTNLNDYNSIHQWSINHKEEFWVTVVEKHPVIFHQTATSTLQLGKHPIETKWFIGSTLNYAENLIKPVEDVPEAIVAYTEEGIRNSISGKELKIKVAQLAAYLKSKGISQGDNVSAIVSNSIETIIAMLATTSLGAVWSSCATEFGEKGILDRLEQVQPKLIFCSSNYIYAGKKHDISKKVKAVMQRIESINECIDLSNHCEYFTLLKSALENHKEVTAPIYVPVPFDSPLYIMYSSGTTGKPKCIIHSVGGTLITQIKEHKYHTNLSKGKRTFQFTTCGWMMWNSMVSSLACGAGLLLFDGNPFYPTPNILFDLIDKEGCYAMGISPKYLLTCDKEGVKPIDSHALKELRIITSTGSPLNEQCYNYVYNKVKKDVCLASISGGTDIIACFLASNITLPVYSEELQCKSLGMDVQILDEKGNTIVNQKGELCCSSVFPSMPIGFLNDNADQKYKDAYFTTYENKWCQKDMAEEVVHDKGTNGLIIYGRSDTVLNPGGVRIGTAEIYRQIDPINEIVESVVVGYTNADKDVEVILFVVLKEYLELNDALKTTIKTNIRNGASPRHVPNKIIQVQDTPKTLSGKVAEKAVMNIINGFANTQKDTLANPDCLEEFERIKKEQFKVYKD